MSNSSVKQFFDIRVFRLSITRVVCTSKDLVLLKPIKKQAMLLKKSKHLAKIFRQSKVSLGKPRND